MGKTEKGDKIKIFIPNDKGGKGKVGYEGKRDEWVT